MTGATPDAAGGAQGSVQVAFVTRSGTNHFDRSIYHYYRSPEFNTNYYFNEHQQPAEEQGRPCTSSADASAGRSCANKAFFFFNYEQFYLPNEATRTRDDPRPGRAAGPVPLRRGRRRSGRGERARSGAGQRPARRRRRGSADPLSLLTLDPHGGRARPGRSDADARTRTPTPYVAPGAVRAQRVRADHPHRLQPDRRTTACRAPTCGSGSRPRRTS